MVSASLSSIAGAILSQILYQIPVCLWVYLSRDQPSSSGEVANIVPEALEDANQKHKTMQTEEINQDEADTRQSKGRKRWISFRAKGQKRHRVSSSESLKQPLVRDCDVVNGLPWPMLSQLSILHIEDSRGLDAQLPGCLKGLKTLNRLMIIGSKCETLFDREVMITLQGLNDVTVENCNELISVDGLQVLPSLTKLSISHCRKLRCWWVEEEVLLPKLSHLYLEYCEDLESLPACLLLLPSPAFLSISDCRKLRRWCTSEQGGFLPKLSHLCIRKCEDLESLPACLPLLPSLECLEIEECPKVHSLPEGGLPSSLRRFVINRCDPGLMERCKQELLSNPEWQMIREQEYIIFERKHVERNEEADLSP